MGLSEEDIRLVCEKFSKEYSKAKCALEFRNDFELLVSARLSAQCKDDRVNSISKVLFGKFPDVFSMSNADVLDIENIIRPCGLFRTKAKNLKEMCDLLVKKFDSKVPYGLDNLQKLPGVGRKTANLIMSEVFKVPSIVVDTHVSRVSRRIGFHNEKDAFKIEMILRKCIDKKFWSSICHQMVFHGRIVCKAQRPKCNCCCISKYCKRNFV